jgi:hypothetical protein
MFFLYLGIFLLFITCCIFIWVALEASEDKSDTIAGILAFAIAFFIMISLIDPVTNSVAKMDCYVPKNEFSGAPSYMSQSCLDGYKERQVEDANFFFKFLSVIGYIGGIPLFFITIKSIIETRNFEKEIEKHEKERKRKNAMKAKKAAATRAKNKIAKAKNSKNIKK